MSDEKNYGESKAPGQRIFYLDLARAFAVLSITFNHAMSRSFKIHEGTYEEFVSISHVTSFVKALLYVFSRLGVPLFLMISGTLLLKRDYEDKKVLDRFIRHNWLGLLITTEIWLVIMFWYMQLMNGSVLRTEGILSALVSFVSTLFFVNQVTMASMWYMPMILCVYLMLPIIAIALKRISDKYVAVLCGFVLLSSMIVPNINTLLEGSGTGVFLDLVPTHTDLFSYFLTYVIAGYWISGGKLKKIKTWVLSAAFFVSFLGTTVFQYWTYSTPIDYAVRYADIGVIAASCCLFEIIRRKASAFEKLKGPVTTVSKCALGIYFIHICVMAGMNNVLDRVVKTEYLTKFVLIETVAFAVSLFLVIITSKNKKLGKYLYLIK